MKAVCYIKKGVLNVVDIPKPQVRHSDDILIRVEYVSICGSDVEMVYGKTFEKGRPDIIVCHEACGIIEAVGSGARALGFSPGDRVSGTPFHNCGKCSLCQSGKPGLCNHLKDSPGCLCEYVVWRSNDVIKLPDDIPQRYGHLTELVGTGLHSVDRAGISQGDSVLILGAGGGGLILLQLALMAGASKVVVMEPVESKRRIAQEMGATLVVDPHRTEDMGKVSQMTKYSGYNCVIDASGDINMVPRGFNLLARGGTLLIYSKYGENCTFNMYELYIKEATIKASYMAPFILSRSVNIMPRLNLEPIVTAEYPICAAQQAFDAHMTGMHPRIRICIPD